MNKLLMFVLGVVFGAFFTGSVAYFYGSDLLLQGIYVDAAVGVNRNVSVLRKLDAGDQERAKFYLGQYLKTDVTILQGCQYDLCADNPMPIVRQALDTAEKYGKSSISTVQ